MILKLECPSQNPYRKIARYVISVNGIPHNVITYLDGLSEKQAIEKLKSKVSDGDTVDDIAQLLPNLGDLSEYKQTLINI